MSTPELILSLSIPGWVLLLVAVALYELRRSKRQRRTGTPLSATFIDEFTATFYGSKRQELDNRAAQSLLREEDSDGAPPWLGIDLDRRTVHLRPAPDNQSATSPDP